VNLDQEIHFLAWDLECGSDLFGRSALAVQA
jgi:hypothetical protein